jgi:hypothetical protein
MNMSETCGEIEHEYTDEKMKPKILTLACREHQFDFTGGNHSGGHLTLAYS